MKLKWLIVVASKIEQNTFLLLFNTASREY
jgi:hypothetical protein